MYSDMNIIVDNKDIRISKIYIILFILFGILIIFSLNYKVKTYESFIAQIIESEGEFYVQVYIKNNTTNFVSSNTFLVDNKIYNYEIKDIDEYMDNDDRYLLVNLKTNLDYKYLINNNYITIKKENGSYNLFHFILKEIRKGMNL